MHANGASFMAKLILKFENAVLKEIKVGSRPISIGRTPDNDLQIDNLAVSSRHAQVYAENNLLMIEDLKSLNGTFLNNQRIEKAVLEENDTILIGKHTITVEGAHDIPVSGTILGPRAPLPKVQETFVMDSKQRRELLAQAMGAAEAAKAVKPARTQVASLMTLRGKTDQKEYSLLSKLTVIGKSEMASVKLTGFFARLFGPEVSAQINKRDAGYFISSAGAVPKVNAQAIMGPTKLNDGDRIQIGGVEFVFELRD